MKLKSMSEAKGFSLKGIIECANVKAYVIVMIIHCIMLCEIHTVHVLCVS